MRGFAEWLVVILVLMAVWAVLLLAVLVAVTW